MEWTTPALSEVKMDAEIGSYQEDGDPSRESPPVVAPADDQAAE